MEREELAAELQRIAHLLGDLQQVLSASPHASPVLFASLVESARRDLLRVTEEVESVIRTADLFQEELFKSFAPKAIDERAH